MTLVLVAIPVRTQYTENMEMLICKLFISHPSNLIESKSCNKCYDVVFGPVNFFCGSHKYSVCISAQKENITNL